MTVDRAWALRNLGIDEAQQVEQTYAAAPDAALQRELIDFDSEAVRLAALPTAARAFAGATLRHMVPIAWPTALAPKPSRPARSASLPKCDVLVVTWTVDEGHALSAVLTPGADSRDRWLPYRKNFGTLSKEMVPRCPARQAGRLGTYWTTRIGKKRVTLFKSDSHMSQDGPKLANAKIWRQIIEDAQPAWVITTGTGGGIGKDFEVGDVIVSPFVAFDCQRTFKSLDGQAFRCATSAPTDRFAEARTLFKPNAMFLPKDNTRAPKIVRATKPVQGVLTTDFFGFDNSANTYKLQGKGDLSEMGDAVLGKSWQFYNVYADEAYAVLSHDWINKHGKNVAGFDLKQLQTDLGVLERVPDSFARFTQKRPSHPGN